MIESWTPSQKMSLMEFLKNLFWVWLLILFTLVPCRVCWIHFQRMWH